MNATAGSQGLQAPHRGIGTGELGDETGPAVIRLTVMIKCKNSEQVQKISPNRCQHPALKIPHPALSQGAREIDNPSPSGRG